MAKLEFNKDCTLSERTRAKARAIVKDCKTADEATVALASFFSPTPDTTLGWIYKRWFLRNILNLEAAVENLGLTERARSEECWLSYQGLKKVVTPELFLRIILSNCLYSRS